MRGRDGLVRDREVADVQLVDRRVGRLGERGLAQRAPAGGRERRVVEVDEHGALGVRGERERVRVGDDVGDDLVHARRVDLHPVGVRGVAPRALAPRRPGAVAGAAHGDAPVAEQEVDVLRGRRPHREPRPAAAPRRAQVAVGGAVAVELVEHAGQLDAGGGEDLAVVAVRGHDELAGEQRAGAPLRAARDVERAVGGQVRELRAQAGAEAGGGEPERERLACDLAVLERERAGRGDVEAERRRAVGDVPGDHAAPQPMGALLAAGLLRRVVGDHVRGVVVGEGDRVADRVSARCSRRPVSRRRRSSRPTSR